MTNIDLRELKSALPHGSQKELSKRTGVSRITICYILNGANSSKRDIVLKEAAKLVKAAKAKEKEVAKAVLEAIGDSKTVSNQ